MSVLGLILQSLDTCYSPYTKSNFVFRVFYSNLEFREKCNNVDATFHEVVDIRQANAKSEGTIPRAEGSATSHNP